MLIGHNSLHLKYFVYSIVSICAWEQNSKEIGFFVVEKIGNDSTVAMLSLIVPATIIELSSCKVW